MRLVAPLPDDDDVTRNPSHVDKLDLLIKPQTNFESAIYLTKNKMAAVFPVLTTSSKVDATGNTKMGFSGSQRKPEQSGDGCEAMSLVRNSGLSETPVPTLSQDDTYKLVPRSSNGLLQSHPQSNDSDRAHSHKRDDANSTELLDSSNGRPTSGFQDTVVTAFVEQRELDTNGADENTYSGSAKICSSDHSENENSLENDISGRKLLESSVCGSKVVGGNKSLLQFKDSLSADGISASTRTYATVHATPDVTDPTAGDRNIPRKQNLQDSGNIQDGSPDLLTLPQSSALSSSHVSSVSADSEIKQGLVQRTNSPVCSDDVIISEVMSKSSEPGEGQPIGASGQNGGGKERKGLAARISKRLMNLFQKHPTNTPAVLESAHTEGEGESSKASRKKDHRKNSFKGRLVTSVSEWRRKHPNPGKDGCRNRKQNKADLEETVEPQNNNTGRVPLFVSPQDQVEIVEDAPVAIGPEQKIILRESWSLIKSDVEEVGVETFMGLFHTHPDSIDSFMAFKDKAVEDIEKSAVLKAHALRVMQTVDKCITRIDDVDKMAAILCQLGRRHVGYKANASLVPMIGKQFISAIEPKMADKWSDEVGKAWDSLFSMINYNLRRGMMQEKHRLQDQATTKQKK